VSAPPRSTTTTRAPTTTPPSAPPASSTSTAAAGADALALRGKTIAIDPGHDGGNGAHPSAINRPVDYGNGTKACDTTGTETDGGYPEHAFTWDVAQRLRTILEAAGAHVVLTRDSDTGVGPCVTERAAIGNRARADAAVSIHADGGPAGGYGFHVIWPADLPGRTTAIVAPSYRLAVALRDAFGAVTGEHTATYLGHDGLDQRGDLGGLDLSTVPKVFIECLNMRNAADAAKATDPGFRQRAAEGIARGIAAYLAQQG
jgi:N-acetylmuramoyl-L-alanine amidase